jgi:hypothetical protein
MRHAQAIFLCAAVALLETRAGAEQTPTSTVEGGFVEYTVQAGDTCESIAQRIYGERRFSNVVHDYNPRATRDRAECDAALQPGTTLRLPREAPVGGEAPDAEVTGIKRDVRSRPPGRDEWADAHLGQDLFRGWRVNTLEAAAADLTFRDASLLQLRENTLVIIFGPTMMRARRSGTKAVLEQGALRSRLNELAGGVRVETESAQVDLAAGSALVSLDRQRTSRVANFEGREVDVSTAQGRSTVKVRQGMGTKVARGGTPAPPRPLPPSPQWSDGAPARFVALAGRSVVRGEWSPVAAAAFYRVEIAMERGGRNPMGAVGVPASVTRFELRGLRPGTYHVAVSAIDADQFESRPSTWRELVVAEARLVAPAGSAEPAGAAVETPGLPLPPPRVPTGTRFVAPQGFRCGVEPGPLAEQVTLGGEGRTTIRCVGAGDVDAGAIEVDVVPAPAGGATVEAAAAPPAPVTVAPNAPAAAPAGVAEPWRPVHEAAWALAGPNAVGVRDNTRAGTDLWISLGHAWEITEQREEITGVAFGARFGLAMNRLRFDLGFSPGAGEAEPGVHLGLAVGVLTGPRYWLTMGVDAWLPILALEDLGSEAQVSPSADLTVRLGRAWLFRTRQGALLGAAVRSGAYWASAYAADLALTETLSLSIEGVLLVGAEYGELRVAPALGLGLAFGVWDRLELTLGGRCALTRDGADLLGTFSIMAGVGFSPLRRAAR